MKMSVTTDYNAILQRVGVATSAGEVDGHDYAVTGRTAPATRHGDSPSSSLSIVHVLLRADGKRRFDILMSLMLLLLTGPLMLTVMLAIWMSSLGREPVFYRQTRVGLNGERIDMLKFRSMRVDAERDGIRMAAENDPRVTRIGRWIRKTRIDELPQLINVLRGEMSLVGPRPERPEYVAQYAREIEGYALRHLVKPGITGLAQVRFRYGESLEDAAIKLYYDIDYIRYGSLLRDVIILLQTVPVILMGDGAR
jgi:exopolysaccharide biosynthesis polyprenyl glycosylphosphotransferase